MWLVGYARARLRWVFVWSVLSVLVLPFLLSLLFSPAPLFRFLFLSLLASASVQKDTLSSKIWGGRLLLLASEGLVGFML